MQLANQSSDSLINQLLAEHAFREYPQTLSEWKALVYLIKLLQIPPYAIDDSILSKTSVFDSRWSLIKTAFIEKLDSLSGSSFHYCCYKKAQEILSTTLPTNSIWFVLY